MNAVLFSSKTVVLIIFSIYTIYLFILYEKLTTHFLYNENALVLDFS